MGKIEAREGVLTNGHGLALKAALDALEVAEDTIEAVLSQVDPALMAEAEAEDSCDCTDPNCTTCNPNNSEQMGGSPEAARSSDGASETIKTKPVFVTGFGFIQPKGNNHG